MLITIFFFILFFIFIQQTSISKGEIGENFVNINNMKLDDNIYKKLSNITLRLKDGSTTQIDHIIISSYGIFVIETKNMKGWIYGTEHQKRWTQNIYGKKYSFQNPLLQNYRHIKALEEVLNIKYNLFSIVVFVGNSQFKTLVPKNIFKGSNYISYIKRFKDTSLYMDDSKIICKHCSSVMLERFNKKTKNTEIL